MAFIIKFAILDQCLVVCMFVFLTFAKHLVTIFCLSNLHPIDVVTIIVFCFSLFQMMCVFCVSVLHGDVNVYMFQMTVHKHWNVITIDHAHYNVPFYIIF